MRFRNVLFLVLALFAGIASRAQTPQQSDNIVILWNNTAIEAARDTNSEMLVMLPALAMMHSAMFDAWTQYDTAAQPTLGAPLRRPASEQTIENKRGAISYAAYWTLVDLFPSDITKLDQQMTTLGYDPQKVSEDPATPAGIGLRAASAILEYRHHDGANQLGDLHPGAYSDYTGYEPANSADLIHDPDRWQPLPEDQNGRSSTQIFYMPQWGLVKPFGFDSVVDLRPQPHTLPVGYDLLENPPLNLLGVETAELKPTGPKTFNSDPAGYISEAKDIVELSNNLTNRQKVIAEYWEFSQGRGTNFILWNQFAQFVSHRDRFQLDDDVKLFFALDNTMFDASIAAWDAKRYWDSEQPQTAIVTLARIYPGGLFQENWQPYLPPPPFPDFVFSHSVVSASAAEILCRFTGSDEFGASYRRPAGVSGLEGKPGPVHDVVLSWATFTQAADESGMSRRYGGIHFEDADVEGRLLGRRVATLSWDKAQAFISGAYVNESRRPRN